MRVTSPASGRGTLYRALTHPDPMEEGFNDEEMIRQVP